MGRIESAGQMRMKEDLKQWLEDENISAYKFSGLIGYSQPLVSMILAGKRQMSADFRLTFLSKFGIDSYRKVFKKDYITEIWDMAMKELETDE